MGEKKTALRSAALSGRKALSQQQALALSGLIQARALQLPCYIEARSLALYRPIQNEVATEAIHEHALHQGKTLFYPRVRDGKTVELVEVTSATELRPGSFGVFEPIGARSLSPEEFAGLIVFVPGVAFDVQGNRLGRGMGWYDRLLSMLPDRPISVALAYELQIIDEVPADPWDQKVDYLITERRTIDCRERASQSRVSS
jgi:5-formyltetrahydrofolate cyclo-ligase